MKVSILAIGNELIDGFVLNKNAANFASILLSYNVSISNNIVINDSNEKICENLDFFIKGQDELLIMTGGLGPTEDDLTKRAIAEYFDVQLLINENALEKIKNIFKQRNIEYTNTNDKQALFAKNWNIVANNKGTADGFYFYFQEKIILVLPGPPNENINMFKEFCKNFLEIKKEYRSSYFLSNISESKAELLIKEIYNLEHEHIGVYTKPYGLIYVIKSKSELSLKKIEIYFEKIMKLYIVCKSDDIFLYLHELLLEKNKTISTVESCTCGLLAYYLSQYSGASKYFMGSIIAYNDIVKLTMTDVKKETLFNYGAVSKQVISQMLDSAIKSDITIATSGIAGPSGGTTLKPVGLVHFGIKYKNKYFFDFIFKGTRNEVQEKAVYFIVIELIKILKGDNYV